MAVILHEQGPTLSERNYLTRAEQTKRLCVRTTLDGNKPIAQPALKALAAGETTSDPTLPSEATARDAATSTPISTEGKSATMPAQPTMLELSSREGAFKTSTEPAGEAPYLLARVDGIASGDDWAAMELSDDERLRRTEGLLDLHQGAVYGYAYRLAGCRAAAEDITQEVFLRAFRSLHQLRSAEAAKGWLLVITRNEFSRWCGKQSNSQTLDAETSQQPPADMPEVGKALEQSEWVHRGLQLLPEEYRLVVLMFYFEQLSYNEIAEQLNIPLGTVMSRLSRGKKYLKQELEKQEAARPTGSQRDKQ